MNDPKALTVVQLTPPGRGAVATLRIEGPGAVEAVQTNFRARDGRSIAEHPADQLTVGRFGVDGGEDVVVRRCRDDAVELHCHGGWAAVARIEELLVAAGCQKLAWRDWAAARHADSVATVTLAALADARTERTAAILLDQYHGVWDHAIAEIQKSIDEGDREAARRQLETLLARAPLGRHLVQPWRVVLAGRVNAGKSSLINALAGFGRSIVHHAPGTTRDTVTLATAIDGWPVELCDTAGLRACGSSPDDALERAGIELAHEQMAKADLLLLVFDRSEAWSAEDQTLADQWPGALLVYNKSDLPVVPGHRPAGLAVSALHREGIENLLDAIARRLVPDPPPVGAAVPLTAEQVESLQARLASLG